MISALEKVFLNYFYIPALNKNLQFYLWVHCSRTYCMHSILHYGPYCHGAHHQQELCLAFSLMLNSMILCTFSNVNECLETAWSEKN